MSCSLVKKRKFDFTKCKQRHVALKILYFGWDLDGLSAQDNSENTVEHHLFTALIRTCLIESRQSCNYNRCGRTDKGVSSFGQVVNLDLRSTLIEENESNVGLFSPPYYQPPEPNHLSGIEQELDYVNILNRVLPEDIKVIAWAPVRQGFSARYDCTSRSYSYIFPTGNLCLEAMSKSLDYLVGEHDFRNLCSFDLKNGVTNHKRCIISAKLIPLQTVDQSTPIEYSFQQIIIVGQAFLYHQIRCIMTILFLIGQKKEKPELFRDLLDLEKCPAKPNYSPADPLPLSLFDCQYDEELAWFYSRKALDNMIKQVRSLWYKYKTKALMIERVLFALGDMSSEHSGQSQKCAESGQINWQDFGLRSDTMSETKYIQILKRPRDETLEHKLMQLKGKKNLLGGSDKVR